MAEWTEKQMRAQWLMAGRLTGTLSVLQMIIFAIVLVRTSLNYASANFWLGAGSAIHSPIRPAPGPRLP
jgi:hypothetical protein